MRLNHRNTQDHNSDDYTVRCIDCGTEVNVLEAQETLTPDLFLCRICYLAFYNHRKPSNRRKEESQS